MAKSKSKEKPKKKKDSPNGRGLFLILVRWAWFLTLLGLISFIAMMLLVSASNLPNTEELENPKYDIASQVLSSDNEELGRYFVKNRNWATFKDLNPYLVDCLISTEDERFYKHSGIDARGTMRAVAFMGKKGGASTITQQLAKLFFTDRSSNLKEWMIAIRFEKRYTKQEIISMYLNKVDFLYSAHGIGSAAETYFDKDQKRLTIDEAATLIGMLKNPSYYNPKRFPERALKRRNVVLGQLLRNGKLTKTEFDKLKVLPLDASKFTRRKNFTGLAPYFQAELTKWLKDLLDSDKYLKEDGSKYDIFSDGLKIYTTIDTRMQKHAEDAVSNHMSALQSKFFDRWEGKDPWTYKADKRQQSIRRSSLNRSVWESDRYAKLRRKYLTKISQKISAEIDDVRLWDGDIRRMLKEETSKGHLTELVKRKDISRDQASVYKEILASPHYSSLKKRWNLFQSVVKKEFNKKRKLRVFAYNDKGYEYKTMTPLDSIKYHKMHMQIGSLGIEPSTGHVKTWVGGIDYSYFKFDHIQNNRQIGSTFKPFVYASTILHQAMSPCDRVKDIKYSIPARDPHFGLLEKWEPANYDNKYSGEAITLKDALKASKNTISVWLMKQLKNPAIVRDLAEDMGISKSKIPNQPAICLGAADLSVMDMTGAYQTFANDGVHIRPTFVTRIEDKNGKVIYTDVPDSYRALPQDYNYVMVDMLKHAVGGQQHLLQSTFGGKTGTTNDYVDGWFMGITPDLVVGTWVGGEDSWIKFMSIGDGAGSKMARPYYLDFMQRLELDKSIRFDTSAQFSIPEETRVSWDCEVYDEIIKANDLKKKELEEALEDEFEEDFDEELEEELDEFEEG